MREFLTKGFFGAILGLCIGTSASASIISRSFLDQALTDYATNTALDLKANQSDFTDLSNIVGTPAELTYRDIMRSGSSVIADLMGMAYYDAYGDNTVPTNNISELINLNYTDIDFPGLAGVVESLFWQRERDDNWPLRLAYVFDDYADLDDQGYWSFYDLIIEGGSLVRPDITVYGLRNLTTMVDANIAKIGTLPTTMDRLTGQNTSYGSAYSNPQKIALPETVGEQLNYIFNHGEAFATSETAIYSLPKISHLLSLIINGTYYKDRGMFLDYGTWYKFRNLQVLTSDIDTINTNIGTVPDGQTVIGLINDAKSTATTANETATAAKTAADANTTKIGTVPGGKNLADMISETDAKIGLILPDTTVVGMMGNPVKLPRDHTIIPLSELIVGGSNGQSVLSPSGDILPFPLLGLPDLTIAVNKIGDLPTEYATVGAALTAMDAKIDARELPSSSADGQYVLSAKKVGDTITYTWVRMDLTSEEQAQ